jgi:cyclopropane-fatty-acyl-phospholipid synthase
MFAPLKFIFDQVVRIGDLKVIDSDGATHLFGDRTGHPIAVRLASRDLERRLAFYPQLTLGASYMQGQFVVEEGTIYDFLEIMLGHAQPQSFPGWMRAIDSTRWLVRRLQQYNPASRAKTNVAHHYDISRAIYELFLDADMQYSCAYFHDTNDLEQAQIAKKRHIAAKLALNDGHHVLDIGCGWGGLGLYLANVAQVDVTGITLSTEQLHVAQERVDKTGLSRRVRFELKDYRTFEGRFDRIVSVGMFEHVGVNHYQAYFDALAQLLTDDGVALIHSIGRFDSPTVTNPFIAKYIFPGGYIPALSEVLPAVERSGLINCDVEILRLHYATTLRHWSERFRANRGRVVAVMGEEFCRMWEFYLAASEVGFRYQGLMVFQLQLAKQQRTLPLTRDYMFDEERRLAKLDRPVTRREKVAS